MFGQGTYAAINEPLNSAFARGGPLVAVHRGTGLGSIAENTGPAVAAALAQGADMVEIDVVESTDGDFFLFHDGYEAMHFGIAENIRTLSTAQILELAYKWCSHPGEPLRVAGVEEVLRAHPRTLFNVDRSWGSWPRLLPFLDRLPEPGRLLFKSPVEAELLDTLAAHPVKYPYAPIVRSHSEVLQVLATEGINTVGMELIAPDPDHEFAEPGYIHWLHGRGLFALLNAINLSNRVPLFAGFDDETSVLGAPDEGWGRLMSLGADVIQTDWPSLLVPYRDRRREQSARNAGGMAVG
ncbi:glycerophosphodiester phosphodiesterase family protein [Paeniglutamicibacter sp. ABSL32-1]|uniref:glycerophosphodiester phosphodiesterase family protein n=1 Tax=Paeniglutamicibacter quisquiliarum TaxID=2849498 RepID=UPI001C2D1B19|nr:glycerophosphodiester phosphodiesterase family protein [Paeniglutamicibacter quisquiliarum]MBV1780234.1 glycerophosphodiester phosphodiesterase family protein [Paeniglutamicibacter quisquiliarum]